MILNVFIYIGIDDSLLTVCFQRLILAYYLFIYFTSIYTLRFSFTFCYYYYHVSYRNLFFDGNTLACIQTVQFYSYSLMINLFGTSFQSLIIYFFICDYISFLLEPKLLISIFKKIIQLFLVLSYIVSLSEDVNNS